MSGKHSKQEHLRQRWPLFAIAGFVLVSCVGLWLAPGSKATTNSAPANPIHVEYQTNLTAPRPVSLWAKSSKEENMRAAIEEYTYDIEHNGGGADTPNNVYRVANLYYALLDYDQASLYYVTLIQDFPQHHGIQTAFANLVTCYERLDKPELRRGTLRKMMEHFGEGTEEYRFAEELLSTY